MHEAGRVLDAVKDLEILLHDETPDFWTLTHARITLREEAQAFGHLNNAFAQIKRSRRIMDGNRLYDPLKIVNEGRLL